MLPLFLPTPPLPLSRARDARLCSHRRRPPLCCAPPDDDRPIGDPTWMNLARSLGASDSDPQRPAPVWKLPDDQPPLPAPDAESAWAAWNHAVANESRQPPAPPRDPQKETDFWRQAARDIPQPPVDAADAAQGADNAYQPIDPNASSTEIWRQARGVTGEMTSLQHRLRSDLDNFNPDENTDQYRAIARELVGPPDDPADVPAPVRRAPDAGEPATGSGSNPPRQDAEPGSGWNPDVDWMRFEDLRRDQAGKAAAEARRDVLRDAQKAKDAALDRLPAAQQDITYTDESGRELTPEEVDQARREGAMFVDEAGERIDAAKPSKPAQVPAFIANKFKAGATYGAGYAGIEDDVEALRKEGIPLRDPKADAERWRSAAKELNITADDDDDVALGAGAAVADDGASDAATDAGLRDEAQSEKDFDESSSWSQWREGEQRWQQAAETSPPRDPKAEVDMWRPSARQLTGETETAAADGAQGATEGESEEGNVWNSWRRANESWQSAVEEADKTSSQNQPAQSPPGLADAKPDWGAGLDGKAMSERTAWDNWESSNGRGFQSGSSLWWPSSPNSAGTNEREERRSSSNNADQWRSAAVELGGYSSDTSPDEGSSIVEKLRAQKMKRDSNLSFWKDIAKGFTQPNDAAAGDGPDPEE